MINEPHRSLDGNPVQHSVIGPQNAPISAALSLPALPWSVLNGAWLVLFVNFGVAYGIAVTFPEIEEELRLPSWHVAAMFSISGCLYYGLGLLTGRAIDRYGVRPFVIAGQLVMAVGFLLASIAQTELQFGAAYILAVGIGLGISYTPLTAVGPLYSPHRSAAASSIVISGIGVGTLIVPVTCSLLTQAAGWRSTVATMGVFALVGLIGVARLTPVQKVPKSASLRPIVAHRPSARRRFWHLYVALTLSAIVAFVPFAHVIPYVQGIGWSPGNGALLISVVGVGSLTGRLGLGLVAERLGSCRATSLCTLGIALSFLLFGLSSAFCAIVAAAVLFGISYGGFSALTAPTAIEVLGRDGISEMLGRLNTSRAIGILVGPWAVGMLAREYGSYEMAFMGCAAVACMASFVMFALQTRPRPART